MKIIFRIISIAIFILLLVLIIIIYMTDTEQTEKQKINYNIYEQTITGFGKPDAIFTKWNIHDKDCNNPMKPVYIKLDKDDDPLRITDSILKITDYCCASMKKEMEKSGIFYLYKNVQKDSILATMEIYFENDKISNQKFRNQDTLSPKAKKTFPIY
jgi:hypothetical protein